MTLRVIERLESVKIEHREREDPGVALLPRDFRLDFREERAPVRQAGKGVRRRLTDSCPICRMDWRRLESKTQ